MVISSGQLCMKFFQHLEFCLVVDNNGPIHFVKFTFLVDVGV